MARKRRNICLVEETESSQGTMPETAFTESSSPQRPSPRRITALLAVGGVALAIAGLLYYKSLKWVPDAEARVRAAQQNLSTQDSLHPRTTLPSASEAKSLPPLPAPTDGPGQRDFAKALTEKGEFVAALVPAERAVKLEPNSSTSHLLLAMIYTTLNYRSDAIPHYQRAIALDPDALEAYQRYGDFLLASGDTVGTERVFKQALERQPTLPGPRMSLARLYYLMKVMPKVMETLDPVLKSPDTPVGALYLAGKAYQATNRFRQAEDLLRRAVKAKPDFAEAHHALGSILANEGQYAEGIPALDQAAKLQPDNATYQYALGNALRADSSRPNGNEEARHAFEKTLELDPNMALAHYYYGLTLEETGEPEAALREYRRVRELDPKFLSAGYRMGIVLQSLGRSEEGRRYMDQFGSSSKKEITQVHTNRRNDSFLDTADSQYKRGLAFAKAGDKVHAIAAFRAALERDPAHGLARRELRALGDVGP